jgi:ABC-type glycerol-3-phosphate transport system permease component
MHTSRLEQVLNYVVLSLIAIIGIAPFAVLLLMSTKTRIEILQVPPTLDIDLDQVVKNYREVVDHNGFGRMLVNSVIVAGASIVAALALSLPAAYAFSRLPFRGRNQLGSTLVSFRFMPAVAVAIPIYLMVRQIGLVDSHLGLILPYVAAALPLMIWVLVGFFDEIPRDIDDAARVDGCTRFQALWHVLLPLMRPGIAVAAIFSLIFVWNEFLIALYVIFSGRLATIPLGAAGLVSAQFPIDWHIAATVGIVTILPVFLFSLLIQRWVVRGVTSGAVR